MRSNLVLVTVLCTLLPLFLSCQEVEKIANKVKDKVTGKKSATEAEPKPEEPKRDPIESGTIALLVASQGYEDNELETARSVFTDSGFDVHVISFFGGNATGALGGETPVDKQLEDILESVDDYVAVVLIGGPGAPFYHKDKKAHELVQKAVAAEKVVGAICLAPFTLGYAGVLKGRKATAWTGGRFTSGMLAAEGALFRDESVVVDENLITANGPDAARAFAKAVVATLKGN
jgi:protease I